MNTYNVHAELQYCTIDENDKSGNAQEKSQKGAKGGRMKGVLTCWD